MRLLSDLSSDTPLVMATVAQSALHYRNLFIWKITPNLSTYRHQNSQLSWLKRIWLMYMLSSLEVSNVSLCVIEGTLCYEVVWNESLSRQGFLSSGSKWHTVVKTQHAIAMFKVEGMNHMASRSWTRQIKESYPEHLWYLLLSLPSA